MFIKLFFLNIIKNYIFWNTVASDMPLSLNSSSKVRIYSIVWKTGCIMQEALQHKCTNTIFMWFGQAI